ncbi:hypothetical protein AMTR_s00109p00089980 [Amborella trichopoda]|uniref:TATA element modulatory factor 1 TATA binding domain-containing protein n=1 Tax=Amborella trichopoda TaxID=13333 RepID=W1NPJ7_AMBTC|nr:hypothetical protein AMTR_s00109p00089980 [Amborella trichopoda]
MAWLGKVSLGGFPDLAGAVNKLSESVKNIEKNFDSALGLEEKSDGGEASGSWPSFDPVMAFMGHKSGDSAIEPSEKVDLSSVEEPSKTLAEDSSTTVPTESASSTGQDEIHEIQGTEGQIHVIEASKHVPEEVVIDEQESSSLKLAQQVELSSNSDDKGVSGVIDQETLEPAQQPLIQEDSKEFGQPIEELQGGASTLVNPDAEEQVEKDESHDGVDLKGIPIEQGKETEEPTISQIIDEQVASDLYPVEDLKDESVSEPLSSTVSNVIDSDVSHMASESVTPDSGSLTTLEKNDSSVNIVDYGHMEPPRGFDHTLTDFLDSNAEIEKLKMELQSMEAALQGAARQSQSKADTIATLMNENEQLKSTVEELKRKSSETESDKLREEYHQRVATLERKVYALTKERDTLRREQNKKSDAAALLKEKDEIISQVMAEGEELSKRQAAQEAQIRKLRAQIREFEEEKQRLNSRLQVEESKVECMKKDKAATEKLLQETVERSQAELAAQKEYYTNALNAAKEAEALAEARVNNEAKAELERRLREAADREATLVQTLDELRQTLSRTEQQAVFREDMLRRDIDDLQKRYQASELRCEELITQVPESTRPLLRQIEAIQETTARKAEAWAGVERALNSRLQEAEAKAAAAEESERSMNDRLSQTLSRMAVLEAQVSCLRAEQTQLTRTLEKERQRASENRQECLATQETALTHEGRAKQLEKEIQELRNKHKQDLFEEASHRELIEKELEQEKAARLELERIAHLEKPVSSDRAPTIKYTNSFLDNGPGVPIRKLSSAGSISSMDESFFLQASLESSDGAISERSIPSATNASPFFRKSMTPGTIEHLESALRQKDGELMSYISRLSSLESIRDSLAEELVKMTAQCEKLHTEVAVLPGLRAELEALRRRHSSALELMGERDEELEELRADIFDLKEMYREQIDMLVNQNMLQGHGHILSGSHEY